MRPAARPSKMFAAPPQGQRIKQRTDDLRERIKLLDYYIDTMVRENELPYITAYGGRKDPSWLEAERENARLEYNDLLEYARVDAMGNRPRPPRPDTEVDDKYKTVEFLGLGRLRGGWIANDEALIDMSNEDILQIANDDNEVNYMIARRGFLRAEAGRANLARMFSPPSGGKRHTLRGGARMVKNKDGSYDIVEGDRVIATYYTKAEALNHLNRESLARMEARNPLPKPRPAEEEMDTDTSGDVVFEGIEAEYKNLVKALNNFKNRMAKEEDRAMMNKHYPKVATVEGAERALQDLKIRYRMGDLHNDPSFYGAYGRGRCGGMRRYHTREYEGRGRLGFAEPLPGSSRPW